MANDNIEPSAIPGAPSASTPSSQPSASVEPTSIPGNPSGPLTSVVQESFKPSAIHTVDADLNSHIEASENGGNRPQPNQGSR